MTSFPVTDPEILRADVAFVRGLARSLISDLHEAEDLAQQTWAIAVEKPPAGTEPGRRRAWLATVVRNLAHNHRRGLARRGPRERRAAREATVASTADIVEREQLRRRVVDAAFALPEPFRRTLLLRYYEGLDTAAIARRLEISEATVRTRVKRALDRMRSALDADYGGDRRAWAVPLVALARPGVGAGPVAAVAVVAALLAIAGTMAIFWWGGSGYDEAPQSARGSAAAAGGRASTVAAASEPEAVDRAADRRVAVNPTDAVPWRIAGTVLDGTTQRPLPGARVEVFGLLGDRDEAERRLPIGATAADSSGRYELSLESLRGWTALARAGLSMHCRAEAEGYPHARTELVFGEIDFAGDPPLDVHFELEPESLFKGRVVAADGTPVAGPAWIAFVEPDGDFWNWTSTEPDGRFELGSPHPDSDIKSGILVASHPRFGVSFPHAVVATHGEARVGDLRLDHQLGVVRGVVRFASGEPAAGLSVGLWRVEAPSDHVMIGGHRIDAHQEMLVHSVTTDDDGRFAACTLPPGRYGVELEGEDVAAEFDVGGHPVELSLQAPRALVRLRVEDRDGHRLDRARYAYWIWKDDRALPAYRKYQSAGATRELLRTADERVWLFEAVDDEVWCDPPCLLLFEVVWHDAGPQYEACYLGPGQHRGNPVVRLESRTATGSIQLDLRDADGREPALVKICRSPAPDALPIELPGRASIGVPRSRIPGYWQSVPADGRIDGLPVGLLDVEVLARPEFDAGGRIMKCPHPVTLHTVEVRAGQPTPLRIECRPGVPLELTLFPPPVPAGVRVKCQYTIELAPLDGAGPPYRQITLREGEASRHSLLFEKPEPRRLRSLQTFAPGSYELRIRLRGQLSRFELDPETGRGDWEAAHDLALAEVRRRVELAPGSEPLVVRLTP